jgi:hypothetical protein
MSADIAEKLRALARDYLEERSDRATYRRLRAELLDGLIAPGLGPRPPPAPRATPAADITQPREGAEHRLATRPREATALDPTVRPRGASPPRGAAAPKSPGPPARMGPGRIAALAALGLLVAAGVVLLILRQQRSPPPAPPPVAAAASATMSPAAGPDPIHTILQPLLDDNDWSDSSVLALNEALRKFDPARIAADRNSDWFNTAIEIVRFRLKQQQALTGAPLNPDTSPIAALAKTLGVDLPAPVGPPAGPKSSAAPRKGK